MSGPAIDTIPGSEKKPLTGRGGPRPGSGRKKGKYTAPLREIARKHTDKAVKTLIDILDDAGAPASARVSAANSILDRGYGKPVQPVDGDGEGGPIAHVHTISDDLLVKIALGQK